MPARDVVLWAVDEVLMYREEHRWPDRVTDVFYRDLRPKPGSLLLGVGAEHSESAGEEEPAVVLPGDAKLGRGVDGSATDDGVCEPDDDNVLEAPLFEVGEFVDEVDPLFGRSATLPRIPNIISAIG